MPTFAIFGDVHGRQNLMYERALHWQDENNCTIDAILQVGDFQALRDASDFSHFNVPQRYKKLGDFADYFSHAKIAPILTYFIAGNHEAWGFLKDYINGGFIAQNIYFIGMSGVIDIKGVPVGGLSGIYHPNFFNKTRSTSPGDRWKYYREEDVEKLSANPISILLLHDWIRPLTRFTSIQSTNVHPKLLEDTHPTPTLALVEKLEPRYVFMGHMHHMALDAYLGNTRIIGLTQVHDYDNSHSFHIVSFDTTSLKPKNCHT